MRHQRIHRRASVRPSSRRGVAPLEYVMALPLLVALIYSLFCLIRVTLSGMQTVEQARYQMFQSLPSTTPQRPLTVSMQELDGASERLPEKPVKFDGWYANANTVVRSGNKAIGGTWDFSQVRFEPGRGAFLLHDPATTIGRQPGFATAFPAVGFGYAFHYTIIPLSTLLGPAGRVANALLQLPKYYLMGISATCKWTARSLSWINFLGWLDGPINYLRRTAFLCDQLIRAIDGREVDWNDQEAFFILWQSL